jgi:hypothetical protein
MRAKTFWYLVLAVVAVVVAVAVVPKLWTEIGDLLRRADADRPSPFERNVLIGLTAVGAFFAYRKGVGPDRRRWTRVSWVVLLGAWVYLTWTRHEPWKPFAGSTAAADLCFVALLGVSAYLLATRVRRHLHKTWKPTRDFFIVDDRDVPPWR